MAKRLTAGVLNGTAHRELVKLEWLGEEYEVEIRPLNNKEATMIEELLQDGMNIDIREAPNGKMMKRVNFDNKANFKSRKKADILTVAMGTVDDSITEEVVENEFPPKFVTEIAEAVRKISGIGNEDEIEEFNEGATFPKDSE